MTLSMICANWQLMIYRTSFWRQTHSQCHVSNYSVIVDEYMYIIHVSMSIWNWNSIYYMTRWQRFVGLMPVGMRIYAIFKRKRNTTYISREMPWISTSNNNKKLKYERTHTPHERHAKQASSAYENMNCNK